MKTSRVLFAAILAALGLALFADAASAEKTVWLCKPGQADNPCTSTLSGVAKLPPDTSVDPPVSPPDVPLDFKIAKRPPVDCFYLYPTQSKQPGLNSDRAKEPMIVGTAINQARMFSRICDVYAPIYRQYTLNALDGPISDQVRDIAYNSALGAWNDYLKNYNKGRGVVIVGHSQGTSHMARLIAEEIDNRPAARKRLISAILPGANVYVPKGEVVGGQFRNIPACERGDQFGCVIAYSMYRNQPPTSSAFGWMDTGYWVNPAPRPDKDLYEALCVNPAELSGGGDSLRALVNLTALAGADGAWQLVPDFYRADCRTATDPLKGTVSWLNIENINAPGEARFDFSSVVESSGGNLHTADINLALENLVQVAASQSRAYVAVERFATFKQRTALRKRITAVFRSARRLKSQAVKANRSCRKNRKACARSKSLKRRAAKVNLRVASLKKADRALTRKFNSLVGPEA